MNLLEEDLLKISQSQNLLKNSEENGLKEIEN